MSEHIQPTAFKTIDGGQALSVTAARFQNSPPFAAIFEVFDVDDCITRTEGGALMATVMCTSGDVSLTEDSTLDIELLGHHEGIVGYVGDVITCLAIPSPA